jgi:hypothetical protein
VAEIEQPYSEIQRADPAPPGWIGRMRRAAEFGLKSRDTVIVALAGFLLRGGIVLLLAPSVVLPSVIGIAGATGVSAFAIDGRPTAWLIEVAIAAAAVAPVWLMTAFLVGSIIDVWLIEAATGGQEMAAGRPRPLPAFGLLADMAGIRAICLLPLGYAVYQAGSHIYTVAYDEFTLPSNLATPLPVRVVEGAAGSVLMVAVVWLVAEIVGGLAVRRLILHRAGILGSLAGAIGQLVRRPISSAFTVLLSYGASIVAIGLAMAATATAFDWCRIAARNDHAIAVTIGVGSLSTTRDIRVIVFVLAAAVLGLAWIAALALSGIASAWRSAALTGETAATLPARVSPAEGGLGLSVSPSERSGD